MARWTLEPILESYLAVGLLAALLLALLLMVRPTSNLLSRRKTALVILRAILILLLVIAMLRPARVSTTSRPQTATLLVLFDQSRSMKIEDGSSGLSRWQELIRAIDAASEKFRDLSESLEVRVYGFSGDLESIELADGRIEFPDLPRGTQTDIGAALDEMLSRETGKRLAGVILLSDGAQRIYDPKVDVQQVARNLARLDCPLYTIAFGKPREQSQARDVAVENLRDQYTVFVKNELAIRGALRVQGYVNRPLPVRITILRPDGESEILGPITVTATEDDSLAPFEFIYTPQEPGDYKLTVEVEPQVGELVVDNNQVTAFLTALDGGLQVLYLEGNLIGYEQKMIRRSLAASPDIQLDYRPIDARLRSNWPVDLSSVFEKTNYDVFLIGDVDAEALGTKNLAYIAEQVQKGKGLMMTGGLNTFGPGGYFGTPLEPVLPVVMGRFDRQEFGPEVEVRKDLHLDGPLSMIPSRKHFITHLGKDDVWKELKPLKGANRFETKPRDTVLAKTDSGLPILVVWLYDAGRVIAFAGDSTHLWWSYGQQDAHRRFWRQSILWLGNKDELARRDVWVSLPRRRYRPGEMIELSAGARGEDGDPLSNATLVANLVDPLGNRQPLRLTPQGDEWNGVCEEAREAGEYRIEVDANLNGEAIGQAVARFQVQDRDLELSDPAANPTQLERMSWVTRDSGGRTVLPEQLSRLLQEIEERPPEIEIELESKWRFGDSTWDAWPFFILFVVVLGSEWWLRKRWGMV